MTDPRIAPDLQKHPRNFPARYQNARRDAPLFLASPGSSPGTPRDPHTGSRSPEDLPKRLLICIKNPDKVTLKHVYSYPLGSSKDLRVECQYVMWQCFTHLFAHSRRKVTQQSPHPLETESDTTLGPPTQYEMCPPRREPEGPPEVPPQLKIRGH